MSVTSSFHFQSDKTSVLPEVDLAPRTLWVEDVCWNAAARVQLDQGVSVPFLN